MHSVCGGNAWGRLGVDMKQLDDGMRDVPERFPKSAIRPAFGRLPLLMWHKDGRGTSRYPWQKCQGTIGP